MTDNEIIAKLQETMRRASPEPKDWSSVTGQSQITELGFDSLSILDLIYEIQQDFSIKFDPTEIAKIKTVAELVAFLKSKGV